MNNIAAKLSDEQYEKNFSELHPPFSKNSAKAEANRCLYCFDAPCIKACPTHIDIPSFIKKIGTDNLTGSAKTIIKSNWVPLTCAKACPVEVLCEGSCVYNDKGEKPIEIGRLQRYSIENYFDSGMPPLFEKKQSNGKKVAVVGSGPAGLACSAELSLLGYSVTVYEANSIPGGLNTWGIAPYKMRMADSLKEVELIKSLGAEIKTNTTIGKDVPVDYLMQNFDAVFIGVGLGKSPALNIPGENLKGVIGATEFIEKVKSEKWNTVDVGRRVAVIGAGNTSIDAATEAKRLGAEEVFILYRRDAEDMSAYDFEYKLAKHEGIIFHFLTSPKTIIGNGSVEGIECIKMNAGIQDVTGKKKVFPVEGSEFILPVDMIIKAIGQEPQDSFISQIDRLQLVNGKLLVNEETFQTSNKKVFAGGDCINGGKEVVNAAYHGKMAAHGIDKFLSGKLSEELNG